MHYALYFLFTLFLFTVPHATANVPQVDQVRFRQTQDDQVVITYDLNQTAGQLCSIELWLSQDGGKTYTSQPRSISGDVGKGISGGTEKQIIWDVFADIRKLEGADFVFKVIALYQGIPKAQPLVERPPVIITEKPLSAQVHDGLVIQLPGNVPLEMVWIEAGGYEMGSSRSEEGRDDDEGPKHNVIISRGFYLGKYEITQAQWEAVMASQPWAEKPFVKEGPDYPATYISYEDIQNFISRLNQTAGTHITYRLPTEAEWEYACRAGSTGRWSFGDVERDLMGNAWFDKSAWDINEKYAHRVGTRSPNPWGLNDMHGNVWEWVLDWYAEDYYSTSPGADPQGPSSGTQRILRGGNFNRNARGVRSADRYPNKASKRDNDIGARLVRTK